MANDSITFFCPACGIKLTVPASLAGVTGPCPSCRTQIQAPIPAGPPPVATVPASTYQTPAAAPPGAVTLPPPAYQPPVQAPAHPTAGAGTVLKPEPRQLPNRPHPAEVVAKQMPEPIRSGDTRKVHPSPAPRHPHKTSVISRFVMLILFLLASGALVYGVLTILRMQTEKDSRVRKAPAPARSETPPPRNSIATPEPTNEVKGAATPSLPTPAPEQPTLIEPAPPLPEGMPAKSPGMDALAVLEKFLAAKTLAERLPLIETKTPEAELAASCLAGPLPAAPKMLLEYQESNALEEVVDFYCNVDFDAGNNRTNAQTILVRTRGKEAPKVVADPFLDLFGGRLAAYAAKPSEKGGVFQVIVYPVPSCTDPKIPDREKKQTLKLLARGNAREAVAQAYFGKMSEIGEMLRDGTYSLSYGNAKPCTIMVDWNTKDAEHPYLEAVKLKALDWNP